LSISEETLKKIVASVMQNVENEVGKNGSSKRQPVEVERFTEVNSNRAGSAEKAGRSADENDGIFSNVDRAVAASVRAQEAFVKQFSTEDRKAILETMKQVVRRNKERYAASACEETGLGSTADKIAKHELVISKTPGIEDLGTEAKSGDNGLTIEEHAPFGVIGAVTPVTNPTTTVIHNSLAMLAAGNTVVFNVHPSSKKCCAEVVADLNEGIREMGGPDYLITMIQEPSLESLNELASHPDIKLLVGTGGAGLVKSLLQSGKKAIGAGAGNPPVIVDETADMAAAAKAIIEGASFDHNILCIAEKEVFVLEEVYDELIYQLLQHGAHMLDNNDLQKVMNTVLIEESSPSEAAAGCTLSSAPKRYHMSKQWIGQSAARIMEAAAKKDVSAKLLIFEAEESHPFVQLEQMMPVLPIVKVKTFEEAVAAAVKAEKGNRHTAVIHSKNLDRLTYFARKIETTILVKNASSLAGVGYGGEGHTTMTIAGPTGEGVTSPRTFTRKRRCVLAEGGFRIIG
jgi:propionaldehyde dehydrogenase